MEEQNGEIIGARFEMDLEPDKEQTTTDYEEVNGFDPNGSETADRINSYPAGNSSAVGAVANYLNTIVGAAIVGLPFALKQVSFDSKDNAIARSEHSDPASINQPSSILHIS